MHVYVIRMNGMYFVVIHGCNQWQSVVDSGNNCRFDHLLLSMMKKKRISGIWLFNFSLTFVWPIRRTPWSTRHLQFGTLLSIWRWLKSKMSLRLHWVPVLSKRLRYYIRISGPSMNCVTGVAGSSSRDGNLAWHSSANGDESGMDLHMNQVYLMDDRNMETHGSPRNRSPCWWKISVSWRKSYSNPKWQPTLRTEKSNWVCLISMYE